MCFCIKETKHSTRLFVLLGGLVSPFGFLVTISLLSQTCSILDCMDVFSKGIHRSLVPIDSHMDNISGAELMESASCYRMLTQMDLLKFLKEHSSQLQGIISCSVREIGAVNENVFAISGSTRVVDAIKCMKAAMLNAVPIVVASNSLKEDSKLLINVHLLDLVLACISTLNLIFGIDTSCVGILALFNCLVSFTLK